MWLFDKQIVPFDLPLLRLVDRCMRKFQWWTGIPKFKVERTCWCLFAVLAVLRALDVKALSMSIGGVLAGLVLAVMWCLLPIQFSQRLADEFDMPVPNILATVPIGLLVRLLFLALVPLDFLPRIHWTDPAKGLIGVLAIYLGACTTWPNNGPKLKDRLRDLFAIRVLRTAMVKR